MCLTDFTCAYPTKLTGECSWNYVKGPYSVVKVIASTTLQRQFFEDAHVNWSNTWV